MIVDLRDRLQFVGFWRRALALVLDGLTILLLFPLVLLVRDYALEHRTVLPQIAFGLVVGGLWLFSVVRWGGTPGKLLTQMRITRQDGSYLTWPRGLLRAVFSWMVLLVNNIPQAVGLARLGPAADLSDLVKAQQLIDDAAGGWIFAPLAFGVLMLADVLTVLFNTRKRALHDFMAGSYVVTRSSLDAALRTPSGAQPKHPAP